MKTSIGKKLMEIQSKLKCNKGQYNSFGSYKYRSCEDILESVKPLLKEQNCVLLLSDEIKQIGDRYYVVADAMLKDCEVENSSITVRAWAREEESRPKMADPQCTGSSSSYARKYALNGLFCLDDTKDADTMDNTGTKPTDKVDEKMVAALKMICKELSINEADLCELYKVKALKDFTIEKFTNVSNHKTELKAKLGGGNN